MKKIIFIILIIFTLIPALPIYAKHSDGPNPPTYQLEEYWRELKVDVSTATGKLLRNWELFIRTNYRGWKIEQNPTLDQYGRYFVIIGRWSVRVVPVIIIPPLLDLCNTKFPPPNCTVQG